MCDMKRVRVVIPTVYRPECPTIRSRLLPFCQEIATKGYSFEFLVIGEGVETVAPGVTYRGYRNYFELVGWIIGVTRADTEILLPCKAYSITGLISWIVAKIKSIGYLLDVDDRTFPSEINKWWRLPLYLQEFISERLLMLLKPLTTVASHALADYWGRHAIYIPNSADLTIFDRKKWNDNFIKEKFGILGQVIIWPAVFFQETDRHYVLDIFRQIRQTEESLTLLIIGGGEYLADIKARATDYGLDNIVFAGTVPYNEMPDYYASATAGLLPLRNNHYDACKGPIKLFEYMAMELPVIATDIGEPREIISRADCGILLPFADPQKAAAMILDLVQSSERLRTYGVNGRSYLGAEHSISDQAFRLEQALQTAMYH